MYLANEKRYDAMPYNRCGKSGLKLSAMSLGLWHNFGWSSSHTNAREMILGSFDMGITHFDIANNYGPPAGSAEQMFGKILKDDLTPYRDELIISSKAGYGMWPGPYGDWGSKKYIISSCDQSLKRTGLEYFDIFYSHRPDPETPIVETMDALAQLVRQGKALYVGISNYNAEQTKIACQTIKAMGVKMLIHQPNYSMFNRWIEDGLLATLKDEGVGAIPYMSLAQGMLTDRYFNSIPADSRAAGESIFLRESSITEEKLAKAKKLNEIAKQRNQLLSQLALAWVLRQKQVGSIILGASRLSQIEENVAALKNLSFTQNELDEIEKILAE